MNESSMSHRLSIYDTHLDRLGKLYLLAGRSIEAAEQCARDDDLARSRGTLMAAMYSMREGLSVVLEEFAGKQQVATLDMLAKGAPREDISAGEREVE